MCMPLMYTVRYFGEHYLYKKMYVGFEDKASEITSWRTAFKDNLFLVNMLYIGLATNTLMLYVCNEVEDNLHVMTWDPRVTCYEGDHLVALILSPIPLCIYVLGWPIAMLSIFYTGSTKYFLNKPSFVGVFGFLYKRCVGNAA